MEQTTQETPETPKTDPKEAAVKHLDEFFDGPKEPPTEAPKTDPQEAPTEAPKPQEKAEEPKFSKQWQHLVDKEEQILKLKKQHEQEWADREAKIQAFEAARAGGSALKALEALGYSLEEAFSEYSTGKPKEKDKLTEIETKLAQLEQDRAKKEAEEKQRAVDQEIEQRTSTVLSEISTVVTKEAFPLLTSMFDDYPQLILEAMVKHFGENQLVIEPTDAAKAMEEALQERINKVKSKPSSQDIKQEKKPAQNDEETATISSQLKADSSTEDLTKLTMEERKMRAIKRWETLAQ